MPNTAKEDLEKIQLAINFITADIQREIDLVKGGKCAGNFLCALGLLCYTEFLGFFRTEEEGDRKHFDAFFDSMSEEYKSLNNQVHVYKTFRCGMAHAYYIKRTCEIAMLKGDALMGIFKDSNGLYHFVVEKYFEDFLTTVKRLFPSINTSLDSPYEIVENTKYSTKIPTEIS